MVREREREETEFIPQLAHQPSVDVSDPCSQQIRVD